MRFISTIVLLLLCFVVAVAQVPVAKFAVTPAQPLMDDRLDIRISDLPPSQRIILRASSKAQDQLIWQSMADFISTPNGTIDLGSQAPLSGSYPGIDAMGLFWSMEPNAEPKNADHAFFAWSDWDRPIVTEIEARLGDRVLGSVMVQRRFARPGVRCTAVRESGIVARLYDPGDHKPHPGVIVMGGSEGGFGGAEAAMLASRGFTALALAYFGVESLPPTLQNIPIEYFDGAVEWMCARAEVDIKRIAVFGISRGTEAALMAAARNPQLKAVVARAPSFVRWEGVSARYLPGGPAWTLAGSPMPFVPNRIPFGFALRYLWDTLEGTAVRQTPLFLEDLAECGDTTRAEIAVEQIHGPVLLLSGEDDQIWPSALMAERLMERLRRNQHPYPDQHLSYPSSGHWLPTAYMPTRGSPRGMKLAIGGTPEGTAHAQADSWPKILRFLAGPLKPSRSTP